MKRLFIFLIIIIAVAFIGYKGKELLKQRQNAVENTPLPLTEVITIHTVMPKTGKLESQLSLLAQVLPQKSIKLSTKLAGYIKAIPVEESQTVKKGDLLIHIDDTEVRSAITSLESALATQKSDLALTENIHTRNQKLYEIGGLPKEKLELSELSLQAKRSTIENTRQKIAQLVHQLSYLNITAPFDGVVDTLLLEAGDLAATGKPILSISTLEKKLLVHYAPEQSAVIKAHTKVSLRGEQIGQIKSFHTTSQNGLTTAEIALSRAITAPLGSSITVKIHTQSYEGCMIPSDALIHKIDGIYVMAYNKKNFHAQKVTLQIEQHNSAIVTPCPTTPIATGTETILSSLPAYTHVKVIGETDAH